MQKDKGFTVLEMLVAVAIVSIITSIAIFTNSNNLKKTYRSEAQVKMLELASAMNRNKMINTIYQGDHSISKQSIKFPNDRSAKYQIDITPNDENGFLISATPISGSSQENDGLICLNDKLQKSWSHGQDNCDSLNENSTWYGG
ncbi:hypothetical protein A7M79_01305 [Acinetobacter baumannii]|uniref:type IV pilin protein n=1 Tax=Acinetobacter baumannii TaxID=470 RepID=UPI0008DE3A76|nr:type IV pilin protein [Acinetobacter baumannii]OIH12153.1 hypothetical protein A7M79_01305 [Acinetobacter baumannii]